MKRFLRMAASAAFVLLLSACARHKIIPDDTLAKYTTPVRSRQPLIKL